MRTLVIEMFARAHGGGRSFNVFQEKAPHSLHAQLAETLPQSTFASLQKTFFHILDIVEQEYQLLGKEHGLSAEQERIFAQVRHWRTSDI
jgi:hypothetical protein